MITEKDITQSQAASSALNEAWHSIKKTYATKLAHHFFAAQYKAIDDANAILAQANIAVGITSYADVNDDNSTYVELIINGYNNRVSFRKAIEDLDELADVMAKSEAARDVWMAALRVQGELERQFYDQQAAVRVPSNKADLLELVRDNADEAEDYYVNHGPGKDKQDGMTGVQCVDMNVTLLESWLDDNAEDWSNLSPQDRREIWESSEFHFGIMGYDDKDADFWWSKQE